MSLDCNFENINQSIFFLFFTVMKRFMITKNQVAKIKNLDVNHESQPVTPNSLVNCQQWKCCTY